MANRLDKGVSPRPSPPDTSFGTEDRLAVGVVARPHGLQGELRIRLFDADSEALLAVSSVWLQRLPQPATPYALEHAQEIGAGTYLVQLAEIETRTQAEALQGAQVLVTRADLPALADDEVYLSDLVGWTVMHNTYAVGTVRALVHMGAQDYLELNTGALVPLVAPIVVALDKTTKHVVIDPPEGLLELNQKP